MCGRATLTATDICQLALMLKAEVLPEHAALYRRRFNIAPATQHWIVRQVEGSRQLLPATWGFAGPKGMLINARAETAQRLPTFRRLFAEDRCLVPVDGFYEWQGQRGRRQPLWFHPREGLLLMAGLYRQEADGLSFVILTTPANDSLRRVHDRMPALLSPGDAEAWLSAPDGGLLRPAPEDWLERRRVTTRVNSVAHDDPECLAPDTEPAGPEQLQLGLV